jgi:hypothetical protein
MFLVPFAECIKENENCCMERKVRNEIGNGQHEFRIHFFNIFFHVSSSFPPHHIVVVVDIVITTRRKNKIPFRLACLVKLQTYLVLNKV